MSDLENISLNKSIYEDKETSDDENEESEFFSDDEYNKSIIIDLNKCLSKEDNTPYRKIKEINSTLFEKEFKNKNLNSNSYKIREKYRDYELNEIKNEYLIEPLIPIKKIIESIIKEENECYTEFKKLSNYLYVRKINRKNIDKNIDNNYCYSLIFFGIIENILFRNDVAMLRNIINDIKKNIPDKKELIENFMIIYYELNPNKEDNVINAYKTLYFLFNLEKSFKENINDYMKKIKDNYIKKNKEYFEKLKEKYILESEEYDFSIIELLFNIKITINQNPKNSSFNLKEVNVIKIGDSFFLGYTNQKYDAFYLYLDEYVNDSFEPEILTDSFIEQKNEEKREKTRKKKEISEEITFNLDEIKKEDNFSIYYNTKEKNKKNSKNELNDSEEISTTKTSLSYNDIPIRSEILSIESLTLLKNKNINGINNS